MKNKTGIQQVFFVKCNSDMIIQLQSLFGIREKKLHNVKEANFKSTTSQLV